MLKRFFTLLLLLLFLGSAVSQVATITIPLESWETAKGQARILSQSLKTKNSRLSSLQNFSELQQKEINQLLTDSENYQNQIKTLLLDSQTLEAEYQAIVREVNGFIDGLNLTINRLERENKRLKIAVTVAGAIGFVFGIVIGVKVCK